MEEAMRPASRKISAVDQARILALTQVVDFAQDEIAEILAGYFGSKQGKIVHDHKLHPLKTPHLRSLKKKKLIAVVDYGKGYGCYYDPPGICEPC
jgi:hypothetical protein